MIAHVTVVGSLNMDLVVRAPRIAKSGETIIGGEFCHATGGKGANQAVAAARLGARVSLVGKVGRDAYGEALLQNLADDGIDDAHVLQDPDAATGVALIVVDAAGQNSIVVAPGANMRLWPRDVDAADDAIASADVLLLQLETPMATVIRAAEVAREHGVRVILNGAPARQLPDRLLSLVDVLICNESETALLSDLPVEDRPRAQEAADALLQLSVGTVIVTLGERGALLTKASHAMHVPPFDVTPVDTTAAGDAFVGGFAVALAEGRILSEAVRWGNAAGALATTRMGAQPSLPVREAVEGLLSQS
jgi:ribokinase